MTDASYPFTDRRPCGLQYKKKNRAYPTERSYNPSTPANLLSSVSAYPSSSGHTLQRLHFNLSFFWKSFSIGPIPSLVRARGFILGLERDRNSTLLSHHPSLYIPLGRLNKTYQLGVADQLVWVTKTLDIPGRDQITGGTLGRFGGVRRG